MRMIDGDLLKNSFPKCDMELHVMDIKRKIDNAPTIEPLTKQGEWFILECEYFHCSICGKPYYTGSNTTQQAQYNLKKGYTYKFCPNCGANMRTEEKL